MYSNIFSTKGFIEKYKKVNVRIRRVVDKQLEQFEKDPLEKNLNNHKLREKWQGYRSIDINNDYRAIFREVDEGEEHNVYFVDLGTHEELYG